MITIRMSVLAIIIVIVVTSQLSCVIEAPPAGKTDGNANVRERVPAPPVPSADTPTSVASNDTQLTLPILDAFFAQETFEGQLKAKLQLTDQQIKALKDIARVETARLRESDNEAYSGSAKAAREEAYQRISSAIGQKKLRELTAFVAERWGDKPDINGSALAPQDTRIVVNAPAFRMDLFEDGNLIKSYRIGIGYPEFPLPTGLRKADTIIFRPAWTPPDEPWVESTHSKVKVGQRIEPGAKLNPLGPIKIPIGLPSLIHGGKSPTKIGNFASHGCIGLTDAQVKSFAELLARLGGTQLSKDQIVEYARKGTEPKPLKLTRPVRVELRYETVTVESGQLHIYRDVYDRGSNTEDHLRSVLQSYGVSAAQLSEAERAEVMAGLTKMGVGVARKPVGRPAPATNPTGKVTRAIRGEKEVIIDLAVLAGKGYPAPVDIDTGTAPKKAPVRSRRRK